MKVKSIKALALVAVFTFAATSALAEFEYKGYMRVGKAWTNGLYAYNGSGARFGMVGSGDDRRMDGRLGAEYADFYSENSLINSWMVEGSSVWARVTTTFTFEGRGGNANLNGDSHNYIDGTDKAPTQRSNGNTNLNSRVRQAFIEMGGLGFSKDTTFWAGNRFLNRDDIHILDYYFLDFSGMGFGAANIAGLGLDLAVIQWVADDPNDGTQVATELDKKGTNNKTSVVAKFENKMLRVDAHFGYATKDTSNATAKAGMGELISLMFKPDKFFYAVDGSSKVCAQFANGIDAENLWYANRYTAIANSAGPANYAKSQYGYNVIVTGVAEIMKGFSVMPALTYRGYKSVPGRTGTAGLSDEATLWSATVRPVFNVTSNIALELEVGYMAAKAKKLGAWGTAAAWLIGSNGDYKKGVSEFSVTPAVALTLDEGFWSRPQIRLFANYKQLGDKAMKPTSGAFMNKSSRVIYGMSGEAWW